MAKAIAALDLFNQHAPPVLVDGRSYTFRTDRGAERFAAIVGQRQQPNGSEALPVGDGIISNDVTGRELPRCHASDVHLTAQARLRAAPLPECVRRAALKARLALIGRDVSPPLLLLPARVAA